MEEAIQEADRKGAPEAEIEDHMMQAFEITQRIMAARREQLRSLEEEMEYMRERRGRFAKRVSAEDRARSAS